LAANGSIRLPVIPSYATNNAHMFYLLCRSLDERTRLIASLRGKGITAVFHYQSLHKSPYFKNSYYGKELPVCDRFADTLVRLPFYYELSENDTAYITETIKEFFNQ